MDHFLSFREGAINILREGEYLKSEAFGCEMLPPTICYRSGLHYPPQWSTLQGPYPPKVKFSYNILIQLPPKFGCFYMLLTR